MFTLIYQATMIMIDLHSVNLCKKPDKGSLILYCVLFNLVMIMCHGNDPVR